MVTLCSPLRGDLKRLGLLLTFCHQYPIISVEMRIIKTSMLKAFWQAHRQAEASLRTWVQLAEAARWRTFADMRRTFPSADMVRVASKRQVVLFNIAHNRDRLIAAVHYDARVVYTLIILTHKDYDHDAWKEQL